jgi:hypothetical protein
MGLKAPFQPTRRTTPLARPITPLRARVRSRADRRGPRVRLSHVCYRSSALICWSHRHPGAHSSASTPHSRAPRCVCCLAGPPSVAHSAPAHSLYRLMAPRCQHFLLPGSRQRWHVHAVKIAAKIRQAVPSEPEYKNQTTVTFPRTPSRRRP